MQDRHAVRVVLLDDIGQVAVIYVNKHGYYKIPGGGVETGEDLKTAARREVLEESGCNCQIVAELGRTETELPDWDMHDISYGFLARVVGDKQAPRFEAHEQERGFAAEWLPSLAQTIAKIENNNSIDDASAAALQSRDLSYLKRAADYLNH